MPDRNVFRVLGYGVIVAGIGIVCVSAMVPFYTAGYRLLFGVFMAGITPYLVYGLIVTLMPKLAVNIAGATLLILHTGTVVKERFLGGADYSDGTIYLAPLAFTVLLLPLLVRALREPWYD